MEKKEFGIKTKEQWDDKWEEIFDHYQKDLRHAYYINAFLNNNDKVLEIASGSFRDTVQLRKLGIINAYGTDFSVKAVELAKKKFPESKDCFFQSDANKMDVFKNKSFDVTFHNGFWGYFNDEDLIKLAKEQARVTKKYMIVTVHNGHNEKFIEYFKKLAIDDELYKIRFFKSDEITKLMLKVCKSVKIIPVGKGKKFYEDKLINEGFGQREMLKTFFNITGDRNLLSSERLLCIGEF